MLSLEPDGPRKCGPNPKLQSPGTAFKVCTCFLVHSIRKDKSLAPAGHGLKQKGLEVWMGGHLGKRRLNFPKCQEFIEPTSNSLEAMVSKCLAQIL